MAQTGSDSSLGRWDAGIVRVVAGLLLCAAGLAGQVEKPAPDATRETLAVSSTAKVPTSDADLVVGLRHATPESCADWNATSNCRDLKHWTAVLGDDRFVLDGKSLEAFEVRLSAQGKAERGRDGKPAAPSATRLRIRDDAGTAFGAVKSVLQAAAKAWIHRLEFAARVEADTGKEGTIESPLPMDPAIAKGRAAAPPGAGEPREGSPEDEIKILIAYDKTRRTIERIAGNRPIPPGEAGDRLVTELCRTLVRSRAEASEPVHAILDVGPTVPWRDVVRAMDAARAGGIFHIDFSSK